jgi:hypothetical protein
LAGRRSRPPEARAWPSCWRACVDGGSERAGPARPPRRYVITKTPPPPRRPPPDARRGAPRPALRAPPDDPTAAPRLPAASSCALVHFRFVWLVRHTQVCGKPDASRGDRGASGRKRLSCEARSLQPPCSSVLRLSALRGKMLPNRYARRTFNLRVCADRSLFAAQQKPAADGGKTKGGLPPMGEGVRRCAPHDSSRRPLKRTARRRTGCFVTRRSCASFRSAMSCPCRPWAQSCCQ